MERISKTSVSVKKQVLPTGPEAVILEGTLPVSIFKYSSHFKIYIYIYLFIYLAELGLSCSTRDQSSFQHAGSFIFSVVARGILVPWPGIEPGTPALGA